MNRNLKETTSCIILLQFANDSRLIIYNLLHRPEQGFYTNPAPYSIYTKQGTLIRSKTFGVGHPAIRSRVFRVGHTAIRSRTFGVGHPAIRSRTHGYTEQGIRIRANGQYTAIVHATIQSRALQIAMSDLYFDCSSTYI